MRALAASTILSTLYRTAAPLTPPAECAELRELGAVSDDTTPRPTGQAGSLLLLAAGRRLPRCVAALLDQSPAGPSKRHPCSHYAP